MKKETILRGLWAWRAAQQPDSGVVLVAAMLLLALLSLLAVAGIGTSTLEVKISGHDRDAKQAFYLCEAGLENGKYKALNGWGKGDGGGVFPNFTFDFDSATLPAAIKLGSGTVFTWAADKWVNFTLVDERGLEYTINTNDSGGLGHYLITNCIGPSTPPNDGATNKRVHFYFQSTGWAFKGSGTASVADVVVSGGPGWGNDQWKGYVLHDIVNDTEHTITATTAGNTLTLNPSPTSGPIDFEILSGHAYLNTFTIYKDQNGLDQPNSTWYSTDSFGTGGLWFLVDKNDNFFSITGASVQTLPTNPATDSLVLQVDGSPASGAFRLVADPWLATTSSVTYTSGASPSDDFVPPSGLSNYGSVDVTVAASTTAGIYEMDATSTSGGGSGNIKTIRTDCRLDKYGNVLFNNWRQIK